MGLEASIKSLKISVKQHNSFFLHLQHRKAVNSLNKCIICSALACKLQHSVNYYDREGVLLKSSCCEKRFRNGNIQYSTIMACLFRSFSHKVEQEQPIKFLSFYKLTKTSSNTCCCRSQLVSFTNTESMSHLPLGDYCEQKMLSTPSAHNCSVPLQPMLGH